MPLSILTSEEDETEEAEDIEVPKALGDIFESPRALGTSMVTSWILSSIPEMI